MNSYGKFKNFEIRDINTLDNRLIENRFDIVHWLDSSHCLSIATLEYDAKECDFELHSVGLRYLEFSTEELNRWLIKWCDMKAYEKRCEEE